MACSFASRAVRSNCAYSPSRWRVASHTSWSVTWFDDPTWATTFTRGVPVAADARPERLPAPPGEYPAGWTVWAGCGARLAGDSGATGSGGIWERAAGFGSAA